MAVALLDRHAGLTARAGLVAAVAGANAVIFGAFAFQRVRELLAVAVGLPLLVALLRRPQRGILVLVVGAPLTGLLLLVPHPAILDGWKQIVVGVMLVGTFIAPSENRGPTDRQLPSWVVGLAPLLVLGAVSGVAVGGLRAFYGLRAYFFYLLAAWAVWRCPPNRKERDRMVTALMICGLLEALYALLQQFLGPERLHQLGYEYNETIRFAGSVMRSFGTFQTPFGFAFFEMLVLLICIPHVLSEPRRTRSAWFALIGPICLVAMASSVVRGAILGLGVGIAYLALGKYKILLLAAPLALVTVLLLPPEVSSSAFSTSSSEERATGWATNIRRLTVHPFGVGVGATGSAAEKIQEQHGPSAASTVEELGHYEPDNSWFKILLELGVLGLWFFALVIAGIFASIHQAAKRLEGVDAAFLRGVAAMVAAAIAAAFVSSYFDLFPMDMYFWLLVGVAATIGTSGSEDRAGPSRAPTQWERVRA